MDDQMTGPLRRHIVEFADEHHAAGQLEALLAATAAMPQRRRWSVRLRWLVVPVWPFGPLASVRVRLAYVIIALMVLAALATALSSGSGPAQRTPFEGTWTSTDTADDSTQTLVVAGGRTPTVHFEDDFSINCQKRGEASTVYVVDGTGEMANDRLTVHFGRGGCGIKLEPADWWYDYVAASDSVLDYRGIRWTRQR
jgi:hypothetical protein